MNDKIANWIFPKNHGTGVEGATSNQFENKRPSSLLSALSRESAQNVIDAGVEGKIPHLRIKYVAKPSAQVSSVLRSLIKPLYDDWLKALSVYKNPPEKEPTSYLLLEDRNTTGLTGGYTADDRKKYHELSALKQQKKTTKEENQWLRENCYLSWLLAIGFSPKNELDMGSRGLGKDGFHFISKYHTSLFMTKRSDDEEPILGGSCRLNQLVAKDKHTYEPRAFYGEPEADSNNEEVWCNPLYGKNIMSSAKLLGVDRTDIGTTFIIPFIRDDFKTELLAKYVIRSFYLAISNNKLTISYENNDEPEVNVTSDNLLEILDKLELTHEKEYLKFVKSIHEEKEENFETITLKDTTCDDQQIIEDDFRTNEDIDRFKEIINNDRLARIKIPFVLEEVTGKKEESFVYLYIRKTDISPPQNFKDTDTPRFLMNFFRGNYHITEALDLESIKRKKYLVYVHVQKKQKAAYKFFRYAEDASHEKLEYHNANMTTNWTEATCRNTINTMKGSAKGLIRILDEISSSSLDVSSSWWSVDGGNAGINPTPPSPPKPPKPKKYNILSDLVSNKKVLFKVNDDVPDSVITEYFSKGVRFDIKVSALDRDGKSFPHLIDLTNKSNYSLTSNNCKILETNRHNFIVECKDSSFDFTLNFKPIDCLEVDYRIRTERLL